MFLRKCSNPTAWRSAAPSTRARHTSFLVAVGPFVRRFTTPPSTGGERLSPPSPGPSSASQSASPSIVHRPYFIPRNSRGSLPVYTDVRNAGSRYLVLIRNVQGNANELARDLAETLFEPNSDEAARLKIRLMQSRHVVLTGGRWRNVVTEWLRAKGF